MIGWLTLEVKPPKSDNVLLMVFLVFDSMPVSTILIYGAFLKVNFSALIELRSDTGHAVQRMHVSQRLIGSLPT